MFINKHNPVIPTLPANAPLQQARNYVQSATLPSTLLDFGKEDVGNYADEEARGWYYDGEASRPFHQLDADILARSLHTFITLEETDVDQEEDLPMGASKSRGLPHLPSSFPWPEGHLFLGQFHLPDLAPLDARQQLPATGILYFFFNPNNSEGTVYHYTGALTDLSLRPYPNNDSGELKYYLEEYRDQRNRITFQKEAAFCIDNILEQLPAKLVKQVENLLDCSLTEGAVGDNLFGQPGYWQGENEVFDGEQMDGEGDLLLLQYEFGEGHIHFWISPSELKACDFSKVYLSYSGT